ncbi:MAG: glutathione peroxidase [Acidobacteriota bacterium]|nr:glutathione peroxidase [Blastocatellia bacterium]MDW8412151.1 glutathione peroxidase [Acidobacteriota bacterium]
MRIILLMLLITACFMYLPEESMSTTCPEALNFKVRSIDGREVDLCSYKGKVVLIVNTASECGFTPQYKGLQELYLRYKDRGLAVLGFPSNDFGGQEPGSNGEIKLFCEKNYKVTFDMFSKVSIKGENKIPLYKYLTSGGGNPKLAGEVTWNFNKFLIDRQGRLHSRYPSSTEPLSKELVSTIEKLLAEN